MGRYREQYVHVLFVRSRWFWLLALLLLAGRCRAVEMTKVIDGHYVAVATETTVESAMQCEEAFGQRLDHAGWHNHIYTSVLPDRAYMVFSQRVLSQGVIIEVDVTLWKAVPDAGTTCTEQWVFKLKPGEVNSFLDNELRTLVVKFKVTPLTRG